LRQSDWRLVPLGSAHTRRVLIVKASGNAGASEVLVVATPPLKVTLPRRDLVPELPDKTIWFTARRVALFLMFFHSNSFNSR
jgi:hypothetical protein